MEEVRVGGMSLELDWGQRLRSRTGDSDRGQRLSSRTRLKKGVATFHSRR
ncbi:unnamed protein product [Ixodes persulcatus]